MVGSIYSIVMGPTSLDVPVEAVNFSNFELVFFLIGGLIVWGISKAKKVSEKK